MKINPLKQDGFDTDRYGIAMSEAFINEPNFVYVIPNYERRAQALNWFFGTFVSQLGLRLGEVYGTDHYAGQAVWISPNKQVGFMSAARAGFFALPIQFGLDGLSRFMILGKYVEALRKDSAPERHWYLMALGVSPSAQRQGIGSSLLQPILAKADKEETPCYLETFSERNLMFYSRHGFEVTNQSRVNGGPVFWGMARYPNRSAP